LIRYNIILVLGIKRLMLWGDKDFFEGEAEGGGGLAVRAMLIRMVGGRGGGRSEVGEGFEEGGEVGGVEVEVGVGGVFGLNLRAC
jgi:hypothetical protein